MSPDQLFVIQLEPACELPILKDGVNTLLEFTPTGIELSLTRDHHQPLTRPIHRLNTQTIPVPLPEGYGLMSDVNDVVMITIFFRGVVYQTSIPSADLQEFVILDYPESVPVDEDEDMMGIHPHK